ncbi:hypothetical protein V494_05443 [Pseudogymnoascus sp. VKM F-4513 (FW-928)]|nr:hypothetical protein V494_05443 [Pseudogymnoascus sp. VKM F-4513 (FW-928)]
MAKITMRDFVRVLCCLHLPADETVEASTSDMQNDNDWTKPVSAGQVILEPDAVPASRPVCSTRARRIRCGSISTTGPSTGVAVPAELIPGQSNDYQQDALTQTDFDGGLGQNSSQTSRHRTSLPSILRVGRAVVSGSVTAKRRISLWFHVE